MAVIKNKPTTRNQGIENTHTTKEILDSDLDYCTQMVTKAGRFLEEGKIDLAEACLLSGLERVPEHPVCTAYLAVCLAAGKRKYVTAENLVQEIIRNNPNDPSAWYALGRVYLLGGRREQAFQYFEEARRVSWDDEEIGAAVSQLDLRRSPVLNILARDNYLNIVLGKLRAKLTK